MATTMGTPRTERNQDGWPVARVLAVAGGVLGLLMAVLLLVGGYLGMTVPDPGANNLPFAAGAFAGAVGTIHLVLALLVLASGWMLPGNTRTHGALLVVWGVAGLFVGFGFWLGALLALGGGVVALAMPVRTFGQRPVV